MSDVRYTKDHEWIRLEGEVAVVGITDYAQEQLGDVVYIEVPEIGKAIKKGAEAGVIESVKAASEIYSPVTGEVVEGNTALDEDPALVNSSPMGDGWIYRMALSDPSELDGLMNEEEYKSYIEGLD
ncbi:MAG: glycine cleavage system protein GcvH [Alphaproteobacteria bacterium]|nr:glycine cleavage system protein GcvH [Alphaproteobacteria bacterium]